MMGEWSSLGERGSRMFDDAMQLRLPHWLIIAGVVLVIIGTLGVLFGRRKTGLRCSLPTRSSRAPARLLPSPSACGDSFKSIGMFEAWRRTLGNHKLSNDALRPSASASRT